MILFWKAEKEFVVLPVEPQDHERIADIHRSGFERGWTVAEIDSLARREDTHISVARQVGGGGKPIVGFCICRSTGLEAEILSISVEPNARRSGIGGLLMRESIRQLQRDRVSELFLEVDENNQAAILLYKRLGFLEVGARPGYYGQDSTEGSSNRTAALVMRLELG